MPSSGLGSAGPPSLRQRCAGCAPLTVLPPGPIRGLLTSGRPVRPQSAHRSTAFLYSTCNESPSHSRMLLALGASRLATTHQLHPYSVVKSPSFLYNLFVRSGATVTVPIVYPVLAGAIK